MTESPKTAWQCCVSDKLLHWNRFYLQKTCQSANEVRQRAEKLMKDGHFDPEAIWNCADNMSRRWQHLMTKSEERRKVVTASYSFFKSAEQVKTAVSRVANSCCYPPTDIFSYKSNSVLYERFCTRIRFETEARVNSEMAYVLFYGKSWLTISHNKQSCTKDFDPIV